MTPTPKDQHADALELLVGVSDEVLGAINRMHAKNMPCSGLQWVKEMLDTKIKAALSSQQCQPVQPSNTLPLDALERARDELNSIPSISGRRREIGQIRLHTLHHDTIRALLDAAISQKPVDAWQPIETCQPFDGLVAYVAFEDGFYSLATYKDFESETAGKKERVQFWSLSNFHDDSDIYKYYGNRIDPILWFAIPNPIPKPPAPSQHPDKER